MAIASGDWWRLDDDGTLRIFCDGDMPDYGAVENRPWGENKTDIVSVLINDGVTGIGNYAFSNCKKIISVTIPDSVTRIGERAFHECWRLKDVSIPKSVSSIDRYAFYGCHDLTSVVIPDGITSILTYTFFDCLRLKSVVIPDSVNSIRDGAFDVSSIWDNVYDKRERLTDVYYFGTRSQWSAISIRSGNTSLTSATIHYNYIPPCVVIFDSGRGDPVSNQETPYGETVTRPVNPTRYGYYFSHWALNGAAYDFNQPVVDDIILTAVWRLPSDPQNIFTRRDKILSVIIPRSEEIDLIVRRPPVGKIILGTRTRRNYMDIGEMPEVRVNLSAETDIVRGRYRLLRELDNKAIASIDTSTLGDLDYVFID